MATTPCKYLLFCCQYFYFSRRLSLLLLLFIFCRLATEPKSQLIHIHPPISSTTETCLLETFSSTDQVFHLSYGHVYPISQQLSASSLPVPSRNTAVSTKIIQLQEQNSKAFLPLHTLLSMSIDRLVWEGMVI